MSAVARSINSLNMSVNSTLQDSEMLLLSVEERHIPYSTLRLFEGLAEHGTMPYTSELVNYFLEPGESTDLIMFNACMAELQQADGQLTLPKDSKGSATFELFERMRRIAIDEYNLGGNEWDLFKERIEAIFSRPDILEELKKQGLLVIYSPFGIVDISGEKVELLPPVISVDT